MKAMPLRGAYIDSKGVRWDTNNADFEGELMKQSRWVKEWRKRYFILKGSKLFYAKNASAVPHGVIDLVDCDAVKPADAKTKRPFSFEVSTKDEINLMAAENAAIKEEWVKAINKSLIHHSSAILTSEYDDEDDEGALREEEDA